MATDHFDDPNIPNEERLFRCVHLKHIVTEDDGKSRVSTAAFTDPELSVFIEGIMSAAQRLPRDALTTWPKHLLVSISTGICRQNGQIVGPDPTPEEPAHGYAFGRKSNSVRRALRDAAEWIVPDQAPPYEEIRLRMVQLGICEDATGPESE